MAGGWFGGGVLGGGNCGMEGGLGLGGRISREFHICILTPAFGPTTDWIVLHSWHRSEKCHRSGRGFGGKYPKVTCHLLTSTGYSTGHTACGLVGLGYPLCRR